MMASVAVVAVSAGVLSTATLVPPAQKYPGGHGIPVGDSHPAGQYLPNLALHRCLSLEPPVQNHPAGHSTPSADPDTPNGQNKPLSALQSEQVADDVPE